jgi:A/G-specific adenine glycosylase
MNKAAFVKTVQKHYQEQGRHDLPWRKTTNPYKITVSEIMLQQTQVGRVTEKYQKFLQAFPTVKALAEAPLQKVLLHWSGLGYNRRARFLHQMAQTIMKEYNGKFPKDFDELLKLPGIGHYTAGAISAFAYNTPIAIIETNIRTAYLNYFFPGTTGQIHDKELLPLIEATLDQKNVREWYWALMDYGSYLKTQGVRIHRQSAHYAKQSMFNGSLRQVRGGIIKILTTQQATSARLQSLTGFEKTRIEEAIQSLIREGIVTKNGRQLAIS